MQPSTSPIFDQLFMEQPEAVAVMSRPPFDPAASNVEFYRNIKRKGNLSPIIIDAEVQARSVLRAEPKPALTAATKRGRRR